MRSIWKGHIRFSLVTIPVKIYGAIDNAKTIRFNQINKNTHNQIGYEKKDKGTGEVVKHEDIVKGYQYEPGQFVILENEDFEKVKLKSTKIIDIEGFVDQSEVDPTLYDSPYYAGPDGEVAAKAYSLLCETLKKSGKIGVGRVVLRERETAMLITPKNGAIVLYKLRYPEEIRDIKKIPDLPEDGVSDEELKLAETLVESMTTSLDKIELKDRYQNALREMIEAKIEGNEVVTVEEEERPVVDIMHALKASIEEAKDKKKPMKKATGKKKTSKESKQAKAS